MATHAASEDSVWAAVLGRVARERNVPIEESQARQIVGEARRAWPGQPADRWSKWLIEASSSLGLHGRVAELTISEAADLAADGALLIAASEQTPLLVTHTAAKRLAVVEFEPESSPRAYLGAVSTHADEVRPSELVARLGVGRDDHATWLVLEAPEVRRSNHDRGASPHKRILSLVRAEKADIWVVAVFAFFVGVLSLATPLAIEALVQTVAFGRMLQPVFVLALMLFAFLAFAGAMKAVQTLVVEYIQRRLFLRVAGDLAFRLPRARLDNYDGQHGPELVNRFFDVVTVQKVSAGLLLDGIGIVITTLIGMIVLGFYHWWLLGFDIVLMLTVVSGLYVFGRGAISTAIDESKYKYKMAAWLEDITRCHTGFKLSGAASFAIDRSNSLAAGYIQRRRNHFRHLYRQLCFILVLQAVAATVLLGFGGWLVMRAQITLGQLVAAELIVMMILGSLAKLGKHIESYFDLTASVDKLGVLFDLEEERTDGLLLLPEEGPLSVELLGVRGRGMPSSSTLKAEVEPGETVALYGPAGSGKTSLLELVYGLRAPASGRVEVAGRDPRDIRPDVLRSVVTIAGRHEVFAGTIAENVGLRRPDITVCEVRDALEAVGLLEDVAAMPESTNSMLTQSGGPLSATQVDLLMIARAIAVEPRLLLIDGLIDGLPDEDAERMIHLITDPDRPWTAIVATGRRDIADRFERTLQLRGKPPTPPKGPTAPNGDDPDPLSARMEGRL